MPLASQLKVQLRQRFRERLRVMPDFSKCEQDLNRRLSEWLIELSTPASSSPSNKSNAPVWAAFQALSGEPNLQDCFRTTESQNFRWAFPAVDGKSLRFFLAPTSDSGWVEGQWGQREPCLEMSDEVEVNTLQGVLVPGLAFDRRGGRLGRGKGYYDQALENYKGLKVGIAFKEQISSEALPMESHDVRMNVVMTEEGVLSFCDGEVGSRVWKQ